MNDFFNMGGYAIYVWSSIGLGIIVLILNVVLPLLAHKSALQKAADFHASSSHHSAGECE
jgi:heme exporter protein D